MNSNTVISALDSVTKKWTKQREAEERGRSRATRQRSMTISYRVTVRDSAFDVMEAAYLKASANGTYPALARQIMYAARPEILRLTGESDLDSQYFSQVLIPEYMKEHDCDDWNVAYDARGNFHEPHTDRKVPLGTIDVRGYLRDITSFSPGDEESDLDDSDRLPTCGPTNRYSAILFVEKEGFLPLFNTAEIAERFDVAIMSTKGLSVTAARELIDEICGEHDIPLLVMHDFDKAGFSIVGTLQRDTPRYSFENDFKVVDIGLRFGDIRKYDLETETVSYRAAAHKVRSNLRKNGATKEEADFLCKNTGYRFGTGERVELNAFTSDQLIEWLESKLKKHGVKKLVPEQDVLESAYRRALEIAIVRERLHEITEEAHDKAAAIKVPKLAAKIKKRLADNPALPWDLAVARIAAEGLE